MPITATTSQQTPAQILARLKDSGALPSPERQTLLEVAFAGLVIALLDEGFTLPDEVIDIATTLAPIT